MNGVCRGSEEGQHASVEAVAHGFADNGRSVGHQREAGDAAGAGTVFGGGYEIRVHPVRADGCD